MCNEINRRTYRDADAIPQGEANQSSYAQERVPPQTPVQPDSQLPGALQRDTIHAAHQETLRKIEEGDLDGASAIATKSLGAVFSAYFTKPATFDHVRFLRDLEVVKGKPLEPDELVLFGRKVGEWLGGKIAEQINSGELTPTEGLEIALKGFAA